MIASTPRPSVSTSFTFGRLKVSRYSSWKQGRLHHCRYQGFSASAVLRSRTVASTRLRIISIRWKSASSTFAASSSGDMVASALAEASPERLRMMSVQPSATRSSATKPPETIVLKFAMRSACQPGRSEATQAGSVGEFLRASTEEGVRWKT